MGLFERCDAIWSRNWKVEAALRLLLFVGCLTSQQHTSVSQGQICSDSCMCSRTEMEIREQACCLTQSQYTDTRPTSLSSDPVSPGAWQGGHCSTNFHVMGMT